MKRLDLLDAASAELLGFDWLVNAVAPISPYGSRRFSHLVPFRPGNEAAAESRARQIARIAEELHPDRVSAARSQLEALPDIAGLVARASMREMLDDPGFFELRLFCEIVERIDASLPASLFGQPIASEATRTVLEALAPGGTEAGGFYLADAFDAELAAARSAHARAQAEVDAARGREKERVAHELGREEIAGDEFIVMRSELHGKLPGRVRVVRESATYLLCALEYGESSRSALERREAAFGSVGALEERVRLRLSSVVRDHAAGLGVAAGAVGELDVSLGAVRFSQGHHCTAPAVIPEPSLIFERARFLPLEAELKIAGRRYVPIDLDLRGAAVLTGPNMGGKSLALQTCGFLALCAAALELRRRVRAHDHAARRKGARRGADAAFAPKKCLRFNRDAFAGRRRRCRRRALCGSRAQRNRHASGHARFEGRARYIGRLDGLHDRRGRRR